MKGHLCLRCSSATKKLVVWMERDSSRVWSWINYRNFPFDCDVGYKYTVSSFNDTTPVLVAHVSTIFVNRCPHTHKHPHSNHSLQVEHGSETEHFTFSHCIFAGISFTRSAVTFAQRSPLNATLHNSAQQHNAPHDTLHRCLRLSNGHPHRICCNKIACKKCVHNQNK